MLGVFEGQFDYRGSFMFFGDQKNAQSFHEVKESLILKCQFWMCTFNWSTALISLYLTSPSCPDTLPSSCTNYTPKRQQALLLDNRSNQSPSLPPPPPPTLYSSLFSSRECRDDNFSKQQRWEEVFRRRKRQREVGSWLATRSRGTSDYSSPRMQMFAALKHRCSITPNTSSLKREIGTKRHSGEMILQLRPWWRLLLPHF